MNDTSSSGRKLDMSHGFIKAIVKNQVDRDEYHKAIEERKKKFAIPEVHKTPNATQRKRTPTVESNLYVPPHLRNGVSKRDAAGGSQPTPGLQMRRSLCTGLLSEIEETRIRAKVRSEVLTVTELEKSGNEDSSEPRPSPTRPLFVLNLAVDAGNFEITVLSTDNAARLAKSLGRKYELTDCECRLLRQTLEKELKERLSIDV